MPAKRKLLTAISGSLLITLFVLPSSLAVTPLEKAKQDYTYQTTKYNDAKEKYITARANYLSYKTAVAKNDAFLKTQDYLIQINQLYITYLLLINEYGNNTDWSKSSLSKNDTDKTLKEETLFIKDHKQKVSNAQTLEELLPLAKNLEYQIENNTIPKINKILVTFEIAQTESTYNNLNQLVEKINGLITSKVKDENRTILTNWQSEIEKIKKNTQFYLEEAKDRLQKTENNKVGDNDMQEISVITKSAQNQLKQSGKLLEEILRII